MEAVVYINNLNVWINSFVSSISASTSTLALEVEKALEFRFTFKANKIH